VTKDIQLFRNAPSVEGPVSTNLGKGAGRLQPTGQRGSVGVPSNGKTAGKPAGLHVSEVHERLLQLKKQFKPSLQSEALKAQPSHVFRILRVFRQGGVLVDLGGGISAHNGVLAQLGMAVYVVDMLTDYWNHRDWLPGGAEAAAITHEFELLESCGVQFVRDEILTCDLTAAFAENSVDVVTCLHTLEHLHHSPKIPMESAMRVLKPGGTLLIKVPNAANLRKRFNLLRGRTNYEPYSDYYNFSPYLGHVREYTIGDLRLLAQHLGAAEYRIFGKNFLVGPGMNRALKCLPAPIRPVLDRALQTVPGLCSCLFLEITKK
jgi:SAM-dependent methyltransferase